MIFKWYYDTGYIEKREQGGRHDNDKHIPDYIKKICAILDIMGIETNVTLECSYDEVMVFLPNSYMVINLKFDIQKLKNIRIGV